MKCATAVILSACSSGIPKTHRTPCDFSLLQTIAANILVILPLSSSQKRKNTYGVNRKINNYHQISTKTESSSGSRLERPKNDNKNKNRNIFNKNINKNNQKTNNNIYQKQQQKTKQQKQHPAKRSHRRVRRSERPPPAPAFVRRRHSPGLHPKAMAWGPRMIHVK